MTAATHVLERLSASDLFVLLWDDYGWSSDIGGLAILDGTSLLDPDGRIRIEAVRARIEPRLHMVPRFRQRLYRPRLGLGWPLWVDAPCYDLADHIRVHPVAAPGGRAQLLAACGELARRRLDPARPLWELWLLPGLPERRVGAYLRLHHAIAAGQRAWYRHFPRQRSVNLVVTNIAGPVVPLYLAGARLAELFPMMPVMGNLTLVVAVLSYAGQLNLTAVADEDGCPDLEVFAEGMRGALDDLARSALAPASRA